MSATGVQVVFDCHDPDRLARFWAEALHYELQPPPSGFDSWDAFLESRHMPPERRNDASAVVDPEGAGPRLFFQRVPESKSVKNRMHLDLNISGGHAVPIEERRARVDAEVDRLATVGAVSLGGSTHDFDEYWVVLQDPEGNEFCVH